MRILSGFFAVMMILFAAVQYNDPDALYWGAIYGVSAILSGYAAFRPAQFSKPVAQGLLGLALTLAAAGVIWYWPKTANWWRVDVWWATETAREGMGMMLVLLALIVAWFGVKLSARTR